MNPEVQALERRLREMADQLLFDDAYVVGTDDSDRLREAADMLKAQGEPVCFRWRQHRSDRDYIETDWRYGPHLPPWFDGTEKDWDVEPLYTHAAQTDGWRGIESAPMDGTWVLVTGGNINYGWGGDNRPSAVAAQFTTELNGRQSEGHWQFAWYDGGYYGEYENPTHWMPLPAATAGVKE